MRNNSLPFEETKVALRRVAKEQQDAVAAIAATARVRTISEDCIESIERGRTTTRVAA